MNFERKIFGYLVQFWLRQTGADFRDWVHDQGMSLLIFILGIVGSNFRHNDPGATYLIIESAMDNSENNTLDELRKKGGLR